MIEQLQIKLSKTAEEDLCRYLRRRIREIREGVNDLYTNKVVLWRKTYEATPAESVREFPFHGASNLIVPIAAIHSDTLLARVMSAVIKTSPLWIARLIGHYSQDADDLKVIYETFMQYMGLEPTELDLYRVYHEWFGEVIRFGTSTVKSPWVEEFIDNPSSSGDGSGSVTYFRDIEYEGPRPEKMRFQDFGISPRAKTVRQADFKYHRVRLQKYELEERSYRKVYDPEKVKKILGQPDRTSPDYVDQAQETDAGAHLASGYGFAEYDIYECHFKYRLGRYYIRAVVWYHEKTNTLLRAYHKYYPDEIFVSSRLFYRDDFFFGYGFCETLQMLQEEISQIHNQRIDNMTVSTMKMFRVDPESDLNKGYETFPSAMLPAKKDEVEGIALGEPSQVPIEAEHLSLDLGERRSGVKGPTQGSGTGSMTKKAGYSPMMSLSVMQDGNTRTDLNITDIRYSHTELGRVLGNQYAEFGIGNRAKLFGLDAQKLLAALEAIKAKRMALPIYAASASINREVEKQSDIMMVGMMQRHHQMIAQMLQAATNVMAPPGVKDYMEKAVKAAELLQKSVMRHFGYDEVDRYVPEAKAEQAAPKQLPGAGGPPPVGAGASGPGSPVNTPSPEPAGAEGQPPQPGLPGMAGVLAGLGGPGAGGGKPQ